jgi:hypothetical protein
MLSRLCGQWGYLPETNPGQGHYKFTVPQASRSCSESWVGASLRDETRLAGALVP